MAFRSIAQPTYGRGLLDVAPSVGPEDYLANYLAANEAWRFPGGGVVETGAGVPPSLPPAQVSAAAGDVAIPPLLADDGDGGFDWQGRQALHEQGLDRWGNPYTEGFDFDGFGDGTIGGLLGDADYSGLNEAQKEALMWDRAQLGLGAGGMAMPGLGLLGLPAGQYARTLANQAFPGQKPIGFMEDIMRPDIFFGSPFDIQFGRAGGRAAQKPYSKMDTEERQEAIRADIKERKQVRAKIGTSAEPGISAAAKTSRTKREKGTSRERGISTAAKANRARKEKRESASEKYGGGGYGR